MICKSTISTTVVMTCGMDDGFGKVHEEQGGAWNLMGVEVFPEFLLLWDKGGLT